MTAAAPAQGQKLGRYILERRIASGGMADVYLARQTGAYGFSKYVALKVLKNEAAADADHVRMFLREALVAADFHHPNLVQVYEVSEEGDRLYLAMELVRGISVATLMILLAQKGRSIPIPLAAAIAHETLLGLEYAHEARGQDGQPLDLVHRDVTPQNILVSEEGKVKLVDFGIARAETALGRTQVARIKGKFSYMSPEQWEPNKGIDARADLFSMGVVLYETSTGSGRLFKGNAAPELYKAVMLDPIPPPSRRVKDYPPGLERVVMTALERSADRRWSSAREMRLALADVMEHEGWTVDPRVLARLVQFALDGHSIEDRWERIASGEIPSPGDEQPTVVESPGVGSGDPPVPLLRAASVFPPPMKTAAPPPQPDRSDGWKLAALTEDRPAESAAAESDAYEIGAGAASSPSTPLLLEPAVPPPPIAPSKPTLPALSEPPTDVHARPSKLRVALGVVALLGWVSAGAMYGLWRRAENRADTLASRLAALDTLARAPAAGVTFVVDPPLAQVAATEWAPRLGGAVRVEAGDAAQRRASTPTLRFDGAGPSAGETAVGWDVTAVIVHPTNNLPSLREAEVVDLFAGRMTTFRPVRGLNVAPQVVVAPSGTAARSALESRVMARAARPGAVTAQATRVGDEREAVTVVAANPRAVSVVRLPFADSRVRVVPIVPTGGSAPVAPSAAAARERRYPLSRALVLSTSGASTAVANALRDAVTSPDGQAALTSAGFYAR